MISIVGTWIGLDTVAAEEFEKLRKPAEAAVLKAELFLEGRVKEKLTGDRHGRTYRVQKGSKVTYVASAPGEAPASPTAKLRQSITHTLPEWVGDVVSGTVGTAMPQARILDLGGVTGRGHFVRILPRPYFTSTFLENESAIEAILAEAVTK